MKYCYMTLLTNDNYLQGVILINQTLRRVKSKYPLVCLVTDSVSPVSIKILEYQSVVVDKVNAIPAPEIIFEHNKVIRPDLANTWKDVFTKFNIWRYTQFEKVIFLDADLMILKNLDHCFEMEDMSAAMDGEYFNIWPNDPHFNSGFFVAKPDIKVYSDLMSFIYTIDPAIFVDYLGSKRVIGDQDVINAYFKNWVKEPSKKLSKYYNIFGPYILKENERDIIDNGYFIHFVGCKPWLNTDGIPNFALDSGQDLKSKIFYEMGAGIISYVYSHGFENINWKKDYNKVADEIIKLCLSIDDTDAAIKIGKYTGREELIKLTIESGDYEDRKRILREFIVYLYKHKIFGNAYIFEMLNKIDRDDTETIDVLWGLLINAFGDRFGKF